MAILYFFITLPIIALMAIPVALSKNQIPGFPVALLIALPFLYAIFGYIFTIYGCWVYNLVAKLTGGFEYTSDDAPNE